MYRTLKMLIVAPLVAVLLNACVVAPAHHRSARVVAPPLPAIVVLDVEPYYYQSGYYYFYDNNRWRYATSRSGPWTDLPRNHYPKETKYKDHDKRHHHGRDRDRDDDHDHDHDRHDDHPGRY